MAYSVVELFSKVRNFTFFLFDKSLQVFIIKDELFNIDAYDQQNNSQHQPDQVIIQIFSSDFGRVIKQRQIIIISYEKEDFDKKTHRCLFNIQIDERL